MDISELQDKLFELLCLIDDICAKEKVNYCLDSGTELGAVREKDFISWDDDVDLKIKGEDWRIFKEAMERNLPPHIHVCEPWDFSPSFYDFVMRIYDDRVMIRGQNPEDDYYQNKQNYLGVDVFLFFKAPDNRFKRKRLIFITKFLYGLGMAHRYKIRNKDYSVMQNIISKSLCIFGAFFKAETICKRWFRMATEYDGNNPEYRIPLNYPLDDIGEFKSEWLFGNEYGEIRGRQFPISRNYDGVLTQLYGDWKVPRKLRNDGREYVKHLNRGE